MLVCLRSATRPATPSNPITEPQRLILDLIQCIAYVLFPTNRHAIRLLLPNPSIARALLIPKTNTYLRDCPGRRHTWVAPALASHVVRQRSETRLATFDSIGFVRSELCLLRLCLRKYFFIVRRLRQQPSGRLYLRTSHQCIFMELGVCSFQSSKASVLLHGNRGCPIAVPEKLDSLNLLAMMEADVRHKALSMPSVPRVGLSYPAELSSMSPRAKDDGYSLYATPCVM